jgi:hypothetical protein
MHKLLFSTLLVFFLQPLLHASGDQDSIYIRYQNKTYPQVLEKPLLEALSYYPEFKALQIDFVYSGNIATALMEAQPYVPSLLKERSERRYKVYMTSGIKINGVITPIENLPNEVLLGWFTHELGHIKDYENRSTANLLWFGIAYYFSAEYKIKAERQADLYAIQKGCGPFIIATKNFVLNSSDLPEFYKSKIRNLYMSPEEVAQIIENELELEDVEEYNKEEQAETQVLESETEKKK